MRQRGGFVKVGLPDRHSVLAPTRQFRCAAVSPILPAMLVLAALAAQFSAAVADTRGSGGLDFELTGGRLSQRQAYAALWLAGLVITWTSGVFDIIAYASRAFAFYDALQSAIAAMAMQRAAFFGFMAVLGLAIVLFGIPAE